MFEREAAERAAELEKQRQEHDAVEEALRHAREDSSDVLEDDLDPDDDSLGPAARAARLCVFLPCLF